MFWVSCPREDKKFHDQLANLCKAFPTFHDFFMHLTQGRGGVKEPRIHRSSLNCVVEIIREINEGTTVGSKIRCLRKARDTLAALCSVAKATADDYLPLFAFVLMRANVRHFLSILHTIKVVTQRKQSERVFSDACAAVKFLRTLKPPPPR